MDAYYNIGLQYILYAFNNALGDFVVMHLKIEFKEKYVFFTNIINIFYFSNIIQNLYTN